MPGAHPVEIREGSKTTALRGNASIEDGYITLRGSDIEACDFVAVPDFLFELTKIETERGALSFVARYGLLFQPVDLNDEAIPEWQKAGSLIRYNELLDDWFDLISNLRDLERLYDRSQRAFYREDRYSLERIRHTFDGFTLTPDELASADDRTLIWDASAYIAATLTETIEEHLGRFLVTLSGTPPRFALTPASPTLAGHAWLQLASLVVQRVELDSCPACQRTFIPRDPRQQYCSKRCATRIRARRFRAKQREA